MLRTNLNIYTWGWVLSLLGAAVTVSLLTWDASVHNNDSEFNLEMKEVAARAARFERRIAWRRLRKDQHDKIVTMFRDGPKQTINVEYAGGDPEATLFAQDLIQTFRDSGANVSFTEIEMFGSTHEYGLGLHSKTAREVAEIAKALTAAKVKFELRRPYPEGSLHNPGIQLYVGSKPFAL